MRSKSTDLASRWVITDYSDKGNPNESRCKEKLQLGAREQYEYNYFCLSDKRVF